MFARSSPRPRRAVPLPGFGRKADRSAHRRLGRILDFCREVSERVAAMQQAGKAQTRITKHIKR